MELDAEKFETVKELSRLQTAVAETSALLQKLKEGVEEFYKEREGELRNRLQTAVVSAQLLIAEATTYHEEFKSFLATALHTKDVVMEMVTSLSSLREETREYIATFDRYVTEKTSEFAQERQEIKSQRESLSKHQQYLNTQQEIIISDRKKVEDDRKTVQRAVERLKQGKI